NLEIMWGREAVVTKAPVRETVLERIKRGRSLAPADAAAKVELCRLMGWDDAVMTEISGEGTVVEETPGRIRVRMLGFPAAEHHVDQTQLEKRLANQEVPSSVE